MVLHLGSFRSQAWLDTSVVWSLPLPSPAQPSLGWWFLTLVIQLIFIFYFLRLSLSSQYFLPFYHVWNWVYHARFSVYQPWFSIYEAEMFQIFPLVSFLVVTPAGDMIYDVSPGIVIILQYHSLINKHSKKREFYWKYFMPTAHRCGYITSALWVYQVVIMISATFGEFSFGIRRLWGHSPSAGKLSRLNGHVWSPLKDWTG